MSTRQIDIFNYHRRPTVEVTVGGVTISCEHPVRVQSMTNTSTNDTPGSVEQIMRIVERGGDIVRLTTQGSREAINLGEIKKTLLEKGCTVPLVADVHFNASVADVAAQYADKVRVNPGNYIDKARTFKHIDYTDEEYAAELVRLRERFTAFLALCKSEGKAIRVGVNHGSLSDRIMSRYGDTPAGVVESCMEFLRICRDEEFHNVVVSIKTSNTAMMVTTVRRLVAAMAAEGVAYPLHLGVTEAGDAEDGRIKSAVGIGALLADGIGDTVRVSLSEPPENEIPVARELVEYIALRAGHSAIDALCAPQFSYIEPQRRATVAVGTVGGGKHPVVVSAYTDDENLIPDFTVCNGAIADTKGAEFIEAQYSDLTAGFIDKIKNNSNAVLVAYSNHKNPVGEFRAFVHCLMCEGVTAPVVVRRAYKETALDSLRIKASADLGVLLIDGLIDGVWIENPGIADEDINALSFGILQATRARISKTEYIACPSC